MALDGVVVQARVEVAGLTSLGVAPGDTVAEVRSAFPLIDERYPLALPGDVEVVQDDRVVSVGTYPGEAWVPDVEVPVSGGPPLVQSISVRAADAQPARLC